MQKFDEYVSQKNMYALTRDYTGAFFLEVSCGGIAVETKIVRLTGEEVLRYKQEGNVYLDDLAYNIGKDPSQYTERIMPE